MQLAAVQSKDLKAPGSAASRLFALCDAMERSRVLRGIVRGVIFLLPLIVINALATMLTEFPYPQWQGFMATCLNGALDQGLHAARNATGDYISVLMAMSVGYSLGRELGLNFYRSMVLSTVSIAVFLILIDDQPRYMRFYGMLTALIASLFSAGIFIALGRRTLKSTNSWLRKVSPRMRGAIASMPPFLLAVVIAAILQVTVSALTGGYTIQQWADRSVANFMHALQTAPALGGVIYLAISQFLSFFSVNGDSVLSGVNDTIFNQLARQNLLLNQSGLVPSNIVCSTFNDIFTRIGGSGSVIGLAIATLIWSRSRSLRRVAAVGFPCTLIGVPEVIAYGLPVVCNPIFFIPYMLVPQINFGIAYLACQSGLVPLTITLQDLTVPVLYDAWHATGGSGAALALEASLIVLDTLLYLPFVRLNEKRRTFRHRALLSSLISWCHSREDIRAPLDLRLCPVDLEVFSEGLVTDLADDLRADSERLFMLYQPQFLPSGKCIGAEALLRWNHPKLGFIYPPLIIAVARHGGFLSQLERRIFRQSCKAIRSAADKTGRSDFKISVNVTGDSLASDNVLRAAAESVAASKIDPQMLWIEITEQDAFDSSPETLKRFTDLRSQGHKLLIDDFGMGQTSVRYLQSTSFDAVKLDGSITRNVLGDSNSRQIISSMSQMCHKMRLKVVAEYVETVPQRDLLESLGIDCYQGYLYSPPVPLERFEEFLLRGKGDADAKKPA